MVLTGHNKKGYVHFSAYTVKLGHEAGAANKYTVARSIQLSVFDILQGCAID